VAVDSLSLSLSTTVDIYTSSTSSSFTIAKHSHLRFLTPALKMGGMRRQDMPTGVPKRAPHVGFAESLVTGVSRPLTNTEDWTLYYFERHASQCHSCRNPYKVHKSGKQLCDIGHELAVEVAELLFSIRSDGEIYSRTADDYQEVRVEIPIAYGQIMGLFKAIQRSGHGFLKQAPSYDRHYYVAPRVRTTSTRHPESRLAEDTMPLPTTSSHNIRLVQPSSLPNRHHKSRRHQSDEPTKANKRGSLYQDDILALEEAKKRESQLQYNLEVREPTFPRRHASYA
jgi:hypothetical protein